MIFEKYNHKWDKLAEMQKKEIFNTENIKPDEEMKEFEEVYNYHLLDEFMEKPTCGKCGKLATQRCSRCKTEWYCGRECQVQAWKSHKDVCDILSKVAPKESKKQEKKN